MTQQHPITPPPELVAQWRRGGPADAAVNNAYERHIATQAARWGADHQLKLDTEQINQAWQKGADQELEACIEWITGRDWTWTSAQLRASRRPKPPSLKEQALKMLAPLSNPVMPGTPEYHLYEPQAEIIRRALEQLPDTL